jgi:hypothetical protein
MAVIIAVKRQDAARAFSDVVHALRALRPDLGTVKDRQENGGQDGDDGDDDEKFNEREAAPGFPVFRTVPGFNVYGVQGWEFHLI